MVAVIHVTVGGGVGGVLLLHQRETLLVRFDDGGNGDKVGFARRIL